MFHDQENITLFYGRGERERLGKWMVGTSISENLIIAHDIATTHREGVYCYQLIVCVSCTLNVGSY